MDFFDNEADRAAFNKLFPMPAPIIYKIFAVNNGNKFISCGGEITIQGERKLPHLNFKNYGCNYTITIKTNLQNMNYVEYRCNNAHSLIRNYYNITTLDMASLMHKTIGNIKIKQDENSPDVSVIEMSISNKKQIFLANK